MNPLEIGLCSWSIDRRDPIGSIQQARSEFGVGVVHLGFFDAETLAGTSAAALKSALLEANMEVSSTFAAFEHEDYSSFENIAATGGLMSDEHFALRLEMIANVAELAATLEAPSVTIHAGTTPPDPASDDYRKLADRTAQAADAVKRLGLILLLETGRETAASLLGFLEAVGRDNVAVNYDCGNYILYGTDDPVRAVSTFRGRIAHAHLKDALSSDQPGVTWGTEVCVGTGEADIPRVVSKLRSTGYKGPLCIERGQPRSQADGTGGIAESLEYVRSMLP